MKISVFLTSARIIVPSSDKIWRHRSKSTNFFLKILERTAHAWLQIINHFDYVYYIPLKQFINNNKRISYILAWFLNTQSTKTLFYSCSQITKKYELSDLAQKVKWTSIFLNGIILLWLERRCGQFTS